MTKDFEPPTLPDRAKAIRIGLGGTVRHILTGQFNEIGYTIYLMEMATKARTARGLKERMGRLEMACKIK